MKEMRLSFRSTIPLKQTDVHWVEEKLLGRERGSLRGGEGGGERAIIALLPDVVATCEGKAGTQIIP